MKTIKQKDQTEILELKNSRNETNIWIAMLHKENKLLFKDAILVINSSSDVKIYSHRMQIFA